MMMSPPLYKIHIDGPDKQKCFDLIKQISNQILEKTKSDFKGELKIGDVQTIRESEIEFKFIGDKELNNLLRN
jgi:translation initiation factor 2 alpha subunit (eIF-2alpha)